MQCNTSGILNWTPEFGSAMLHTLHNLWVFTEYSACVTPVVYKTEEQDLAVQCNTRLLVFTPHNAYMAQKCRPGFSRALLFTAPVHASERVELMLL